jgi:hypothetical protein
MGEVDPPAARSRILEALGNNLAVESVSVVGSGSSESEF